MPPTDEVVCKLTHKLVRLGSGEGISFLCQLEVLCPGGVQSGRGLLEHNFKWLVPVRGADEATEAPFNVWEEVVPVLLWCQVQLFPESTFDNPIVNLNLAICLGIVRNTFGMSNSQVT